MYNYNNEDYLMHYGVLGMKWGVRRANKFANKASVARKSAKEWDEMASYAAKKGKSKKAEKYKQNAAQDRADANAYAAKSKQIQQKHEQRAGGKAAYDYSAKQSVGKNVAKSMLLSTYGTLRYNEARAKGATRGEAAIAGILTGFANNLSGGVVSIVEPRLRQDKYKNMAKSAVKSTKEFVNG